MIRSNIAVLLMAIVVTCAFASAQAGQVAQTDSSVQAARADLPQAGSTDTQLKQRDQRYRLRKSDVIGVKFTFSSEFTPTCRPVEHLTRREATRKAKESLESANVRLLGTVLNNRTFPIPETIYRNI